MLHPNKTLAERSSGTPPQPGFRSGAVARMAGMPVSTLRIWEQRYQAVAPVTAASGHRLYSTSDVERVVLLRQLTEHGHAIGSLAGLDMNQLQDVALARANTEAPLAIDTAARLAPWRIAVVGQAMALRLKRPGVFRHWPKPPQVVAVFDTLAEAAAAAVPAGTTREPIDLLLWHAAGLHETAANDLQAAQDAWGPCGVAVAYRFAGAAARHALSGTGVYMVREPADDETLGAWLWSLHTALCARTAADHPPDAHAAPALPARRFDDASLTAFAGRSTGMACECPSHVAELLMQVAAFESYSADCAHRHADDAELHAYLQQVAGAARVLFESALERVAVAEGLALP